MMPQPVERLEKTAHITAEWEPELEVLAKERGYSTTSATEIELRFEVFVDLLAKA